MQALNIIENTSVFITWEAHKTSSIFRIREQKEYIRHRHDGISITADKKPMFSHLNTKEKMNTCLGIMKLWLNFQEILAAAIEPNASSQESWCEHIDGERVFGMLVARDVFRLREVRRAAQRAGQATVLWEQCATRAPLKGTAVENRD